MQLKVTRSLKEGGIISKSTIFCLDVRAAFTEEVTAMLNRFKWGGMVLYDSEVEQGTKLSSSDSFRDAWAKGRASAGRLKIRITPDSLRQGHRFENADLAEVSFGLDAIRDACRNLQRYFENAKPYDGREAILEFTSDDKTMVIAA